MAATGAVLAAFVLLAVPQIPEAQRMLDFSIKGSFITAASPAERDFLLAMAAEAKPVVAPLGYSHLSTARADKDGKIAYLEFVPARGQDSRSGPSAKVEFYPLEGKSEKQLDEFTAAIFRVSGAAADTPAKVVKLEEMRDRDGRTAAYAVKLAGRETHYAAAFRQGAHIMAITLRSGPDGRDTPGKDSLRKLLPEGKTIE
ncbi:MAG: hypothetical protein ACAH80_18825 [Alphaproteobacteria bacterium]